MGNDLKIWLIVRSGKKLPINYVLAVDAGTSSVRCLVVDLNGHLVSLCRREWGYQSSDDIGFSSVEFDPEAFWCIIGECIAGALKDAGISGRAIVGVSATSQREGVVFLDKDGNELYAGPNIDIRALTEGISIDSEFSNEIYSITGHTPSFLFVPAKLRWFETNRPEIYDRIATILTISDWIIYRLCGELVSEACGASELGLVDIKDRKWSNRLKDLLTLPDGIYPELVPAGSQVGRVTPQAAVETGILARTPVVQGAPDTHCGLMGMGVKEKGQVGIVLGWSAPVQMVTDKPILDPEGKIWASCYPLPDKWILESNAGEAGNAYRWLKEMMFGQDELLKEEPYGLMDDLALAAPAGAEEVLAFVGPSVMNMGHLTLDFGGFLFPLPLSVTNIHRAHLVRAALENLCFAIKANCLQLEVISTMKIQEVVIGGGMTRSRCLAQILPAVLGMPVYVSEIAEVSGLGAAMCAAVGSGTYSSLEEGMKAMTSPLRIIEPDSLLTLEYTEYYQRWTSTAKWLKKLSEEMK